MKRLLGMCLLGVLAGVLVAGPALAQYTGGSPPNLPAAEPGSGAAAQRPGTGGTGTGGTGTGGTGTGGTGTGGTGTGTGTVEVRTPQAPVRSLVLTGADIATMSAAALTAVIVGSVLVRRSRHTQGQRQSG